MSLQPEEDFNIPDETRRVALAAFPKGCACLHISNVLGGIYQDKQFASLFPRRGQPAESPGRLAFITVLQFMEGFSDRQTADAVRGRIDWKYALGLELTDPGFDHTVLSEFRTRLVVGKLELALLDVLLEQVQGLGLLKQRGKQRTDSTHVLAAIRTMNRLERVGETLRAALNALAVAGPEWLRTVADPEWFKRYGSRVENFNLPKTEAARQQLATIIGSDGKTLLRAVDASEARIKFRKLAEVLLLERVWNEQFIDDDDGQPRLRKVEQMPPPAELVTSPYDPDARYSTKRGNPWVGYKVHLTESCDVDTPRLITNVETTPATTPDDNMIEVIHRSLQCRNLLPAEHLVDKGYTDAKVLVVSRREHGVEIIGPVAQDPSWQSRDSAGFDKSAFTIDWDRKVVICPERKQSVSWLPSTYPAKGTVFEARFARRDCTPCASRLRCTRAKREPRIIGLQTREYHDALQTLRKRQTTDEFRKAYAARSGIESTHAQAIRCNGLRRTRYRGLAKTRLQHVVTAAAINFLRIAAWANGTPVAQTRCSHFAALQFKTT
ncbi:MAG TPA: IS1182 family transposase [Acidobacteriaceae bacterium]|jgi:transposase